MGSSMLFETFIASSSAPPKLTAANSSLLKDAGIFFHSFQPKPALRNTFKNSSTQANCLAVSETHIFAAQINKAVVHVYNREKGNHELTVPFPERIETIALAAENSILVLGTANGNIFLWELTTGRQITAPQSHLQGVTKLAIDQAFLLSGSADSNVLVWSIIDLLSFSQSKSLSNDPQGPRLTLSSHRGPITDLVIGHSATSVNIAISTSRDQTANIWNYHTGELLRTYLLPSVALCLALDPADRAFYAGFEQGGIQLIDFYPTTTTSAVSALHDTDQKHVALQPDPLLHWSPPSKDLGSTLSLALSYDGTSLISGHASGKIIPWDTVTGQTAAPLADYVGSPITNLLLPTPVGFQSQNQNQKASKSRAPQIIKPRPHEFFSGSHGHLSGDYNVSAHFSIRLPPELASSYTPAGVSHALLGSGIADLAAFLHHTNGTKKSEDFLPLDGDLQGDLQGDFKGDLNGDLKGDYVRQLEQQIENLKYINAASIKQISALGKERSAWREREKMRAKRKQERTSVSDDDESSASD